MPAGDFDYNRETPLTNRGRAVGAGRLAQGSLSMSFSRQRQTRSTAKQRHHRSPAGSALTIVVLALLLILGIGAVVWYSLNQTGEEEGEAIITTVVTRGPYEHVVLEQGQVESADSIEIRCQVKTSSGSGAQVKWVIPEGSHVKKGDKLVELNAASLENSRIQQQIVCNTSAALVVQAENTLAAAQISRTEYLEGTFKQQEQVILSKVFVAEENLRRAQLAFKSTERLAARGVVTALQLEGDQFAVDKARNELSAAQIELDVLRKYTQAKMLKQFDSDIATAEAKLDAEKKSHELEMKNLHDIEEQIGFCTITAPEDGQVVYANMYSRRGGGAEFVLEEGASVREGQALIRLPDSEKMQIKATVNESRISLIQPGMPVAITLDAVKDQTLQGEVTKVNQYAEPGGWSSGNIKEYAAFISVTNPIADIRSGMNAEVRIYVDRQEDALQVPVQALYETKGHYFCLVKDGAGWLTREVQVGSSNDSFMTIKDGVKEGEQVAMNPRAYPELLEIPELPDDPVEEAVAKSAKPGGAPKPGSAPGSAVVGGPGAGGPDAGKPGAGGPPGGGQFDPAAAFARLDANSDGSISVDEMASLPGGFKDRVAAADTNGDGSVSREEFTASLQNRGGGPPGAGAGAAGAGAAGAGAAGAGAGGAGAAGGGA